MRNSLLVEGLCAENLTGLKRATEAAGLPNRVSGRGAYPAGRSPTVRRDGLLGSENPGMSSSEDRLETCPPEAQGFRSNVNQGRVSRYPKVRAKAVADGKQVNIPAPAVWRPGRDAEG